MKLQRLSLLNFKNIEECELLPTEGINCIVGSNGAGKTNVVDAVHYLSMSKSSLPMTDGQCLRHGAPFFMLQGDYTTDGEMGVTVNCSFKKGEGKSLKFCGKEYPRLADHIGVIPVVMVSPSDGALVVEAAEERRRWLNAFISQLDHSYLDATMRYNRLLAERNTLLKQGEMLPPELLEVIDEQLMELGERVAGVRREVLARLAPLVETIYTQIAGERESVELAYRSELNTSPYGEILVRNRQKDMIMGFTTAGPHRDDVVMTIGGYPLRKFGSQGQQKSFLLALKLAQYNLLHERLGERPLLLLDDLFDKLDEERLSRLVELTSGEEYGQVFITDCNRERLISVLKGCNLEFRLFSVEGGEVKTEEV
ncbi:MAG: DNA replication/repair protein RecF [Tidjanibacter sp.]|nr:DNA replication/repair protein RecF [Tidjanibacter sp.]